MNALSRLSIRCEVVDGGELGRDRAADLLRRRVGRAQLGELLLERLEPAQPQVEVGVGQGRVVEHVVAPAGVLDLLGQRLVALPRLGGTRSGPAAEPSGRRLMGHILPCRTDSRADSSTGSSTRSRRRMIRTVSG